MPGSPCKRNISEVNSARLTASRCAGSELRSMKVDGLDDDRNQFLGFSANTLRQGIDVALRFQRRIGLHARSGRRHLVGVQKSLASRKGEHFRALGSAGILEPFFPVGGSCAPRRIGHYAPWDKRTTGAALGAVAVADMPPEAFRARAVIKDPQKITKEELSLQRRDLEMFPIVGKRVSGSGAKRLVFSIIAEPRI